MMLRQVTGESMLPCLRPGQLVLARRKVHALKAGDVIIIRHDGVEKIKRLKAVEAERIFVLGDNAEYSTDSRHFGWLPRDVIKSKVIWPRIAAA